jgi:hypothetical protein
MRCSALAQQLTLRHDILKGILRRAVHRASTLEPALRRCRLFRGRIPHLSRGSWRRPPHHAPRHRVTSVILSV